MSLKPLEDQDVSIRWTAWRMPEGANPPEKPEGYGEGAKVFLENLLEETGLEIHPPSEKRDTYLAHVGAKYAKEKGIFSAYHKRVFEAVWKYDENIEDKDVLQKMAKEVGLDPEEFLKALDSDEFKQKVEQDFELADERDIWTIPSYISSQGEIQVHHYKDIPSVEELKKIL